MAFTARWHLWETARSAEIVLALIAAIETELLVDLIEADPIATAVTHSSSRVRTSISSETLNQPMLIATIQFWFLIFLLSLLLWLLLLFFFLLLFLLFRFKVELKSQFFLFDVFCDDIP